MPPREVSISSLNYSPSGTFINLIFKILCYIVFQNLSYNGEHQSLVCSYH